MYFSPEFGGAFVPHPLEGQEGVSTAFVTRQNRRNYGFCQYHL